VEAQAPDYWYRLNNDLTNSGSQAAPDLDPFGGGFGPDIENTADMAYQMIQATNRLEQTNDLIGSVGSMSFLIRSPGETFSGFRQALSQGMDQSASNAFAVFFFNDLKFRVGNTTATILPGAPAVDTWYYFAATWDDSKDSGEANWWFGPVGGTLSNAVLNINNDAVIGDDGTLFLGNRGVGDTVAWRQPDNPGTLDEIAIWDRELTSADVSNQFNAVTQPIAAITLEIFSINLGTNDLGADGVVLELNTLSGSDYVVEWTGDVLSNSWDEAEEVTGTDTNTTWVDVGGTGRPDPLSSGVDARYYRYRDK
jgi:hypothetical protein